MRKADSVSNKDCDLKVHDMTVNDAPLGSGNSKFVSNSSEFTKFKGLTALNLNYNDSSFGGDEHNGSYSFINNLRG